MVINGKLDINQVNFLCCTELYPCMNWWDNSSAWIATLDHGENWNQEVKNIEQMSSSCQKFEIDRGYQNETIVI